MKKILRNTICMISLSLVILFASATTANAATCTTFKCKLQSFFGNYFQSSGNTSSNKNNIIKQPTVSAPSNTPKPTSPAEKTNLQSQMLNLINEERTANGLAPLTWNASLANVAAKKAEDMKKNNYFSHTSPTYGSPFDMMKANGIKYRYAAENIAKNSSVTKAHVALMNSEGHRKNILNPNYTSVGIGIVNITSSSYIIVQMFIG